MFGENFIFVSSFYLFLPAPTGGQEIRPNPGSWIALSDHGLCNVWFMCRQRGYQDASGGDSFLAPQMLHMLHLLWIIEPYEHPSFWICRLRVPSGYLT